MVEIEDIKAKIIINFAINMIKLYFLYSFISINKGRHKAIWLVLASFKLCWVIKKPGLKAFI